MTAVFLSYAREDTARVRPIAKALEAAGHSVWWDQHITGGDQFAHAIEQALDSADTVVVAWSQASCDSPWVRDEAAAGRDTNRLVPLCLDGCTVPLGFRQFQVIDLRSWNGRSSSKALEPLKQAIAAKSGATDAAARKPAQRKAAKSTGSAVLQRPRIILASLTVLIVAAAAAILIARSGLFGGGDSVAPQVALGQFEVLSPDLPQAMSRAMNDEIMAAFGAENAVALTTTAGIGRAAPFVLNGSLRKDADALRTTVSLKDSRSGTVLWTRAFDFAAADPLATRNVAVAASQVIRCGLWGASAYPRRMPDQALSLYLQLCNEQWGGSPDEQRILEAARRITVALPDFSFAWSALALAAVPLGHGSGVEAAAIRAEGVEAARKATELDSDNPEGYMAEAGLLPTDRFAEREALLKRAISVRPTECGCERTAYGDFLTSVGRIEEAIEQYQRTQALMPLSPATTLRLAHALYLSGDDEKAERITADMLKIWPDAIALRQVRLKSALWTRRYDEALTMLGEKGLHLSRAQQEALRATFQALRSNDFAGKAAAVATLQGMSQNVRHNDRMVVAALAALGAHDPALDAAQRLIRERGHPLADVLFEPNLAAASPSPHYSALVTGLGLASYWRNSKNLPDLCQRPAKPAFCTI